MRKNILEKCGGSHGRMRLSKQKRNKEERKGNILNNGVYGNPPFFL